MAEETERQGKEVATDTDWGGAPEQSGFIAPCPWASLRYVVAATKYVIHVYFEKIKLLQTLSWLLENPK